MHYMLLCFLSAFSGALQVALLIDYYLSYYHLDNNQRVPWMMLRALCLLSLVFIGQMFAAYSRCVVCLKDSNMCILWFLELVSNPRWGKSAWCQGLSTSGPQRRRCWRALTPSLCRFPGEVRHARHSSPPLLRLFQGWWEWSSLEGEYYFYFSFTCVILLASISLC